MEQTQDREQKSEQQQENVKAVMFVPYTVGSILAKQMRDAENTLQSMTGYRLKIVERAGTKLEDILTKADPVSIPLPRYSFLNRVTYNHSYGCEICRMKVDYLFNLLQGGFIESRSAKEGEECKFYPVAPLPAPDVLEEALRQQTFILVVAQDHRHLVPGPGGE